MTKCRGCGHNSRTNDVCERCGTRFSTLAQPTLQMPPQVQTVRRVSLTGEVVETTQAMAPPTIMGAPPGLQPGAPGQAYPPGPGFAGPSLAPNQALPPGAYSPAAIM